MRKYWVVIALILLSLVFGATVLREPIARAAQSIKASSAEARQTRRRSERSRRNFVLRLCTFGRDQRVSTDVSNSTWA